MTILFSPIVGGPTFIRRSADATSMSCVFSEASRFTSSLKCWLYFDLVDYFDLLAFHESFWFPIIFASLF
ncbi:unnamed protein product, partial [Schistosoma bovis]